MRCLIVGGDGMLGHQLLKSWQARHDVRVTLRGDLREYLRYGLFSRANSFDGVDIRNTDRLTQVLAEFQPQAVVNAVGIIKQRPSAKDSILSLETNAVFPHRLRLLCDLAGARLLHVSTDCVFNGRRGNYTEADPADAEDLYGLSKYLGEVRDAPAITLRTSIIGLELSRNKSLIEWFLAQRGTIRGFTKAIYTGVTTSELARVIESVLLDHADLSGVWHVASDPIAKYDLLCKLSGYLGRRDVTIEPDDSLVCDRSLCGRAFAEQTNYHVPDWEKMLKELAAQVHQKGFCHEAA